ncbi:MAG: DNA-binding domain-containing protein [Sphingomicrobium sp.]
MQPDILTFQRDFAAALDQPASGPMAVYRNTVLHGAVEALRANFCVVEKIVGTEMFEKVAVDFAAECPPRRPILVLYGERFADWLEDQPWIEDVPYLPDVARVERLWIESLMAADAEPLSARDGLGRKLLDLELVLHPAVRFGWLSTPAMSIWLAHQRPISSELKVDWKAEGALFARPSHDILHAPRIGPAAHRLLFGLRLGESVRASMNAAERLYPEEDCEALFASLLNLGAFAAPTSERNN